TDAATADAATGSGGRGGVRPYGFGRLLLAEWIKFRSLRSNWWVLAAGVLFVPLFAVSRVLSVARVPEAVGAPGTVGAVYVTSGVALTQLALCALAVLAVTGEYGTGQIRSTFTAAPRRLQALAAKLAVTVLVVLAASVLAVALAWAAGAVWFERIGTSVDLLRAEDARIVLGAPLYLAALSALAFGIGTIVRSSAAAVALVLGLLLVVENLLSLVPWAPVQAFAAHLPATAGSRLLQSDAVGSVLTTSASTALSPWGGFAVLLAWVALVLTAAAVLVRRRDA
ncbi:ABC transporter permease, partial [Kineococcus sp. T13]|uniref:ABC transporter permease n=1 Tax=Kineococcus vitellinus TaxID=2696565 RepID=UPI0014121ABB